VIDGITEGNRYPDSATIPLLAALAQKHSVPPPSIVLGNGSTEILRIAVTTFGGADATIVLADPTFEDVYGYSTPFAPRLERIPLTADFAHDVLEMRTRAEATDGPVLAYICNPNNPTGTLTDCGAIDEWIARAPDNVFFLIDEAYFEYANSSDYWTSVKWVADKRNVLVVRTFSKIYAMAGMRVGYGMAHPETAAQLHAYVTRNTPNHLAGAAALASLQDEDMVPRSLENNRRCMEIVLGAFDELGIEYLPSHTNFVMHRVSGDLATYIERMREHDVRVGRQFPPMLGYNRLSMGLPEEMEAFVGVLRTFRERGWA
jgi:histidinol-phosphate aminotransferase